MNCAQPEQRRRAMTADDIYLSNGHINLHELSKQLANETRLKTTLFKLLIRECIQITSVEPNLIEISDPVTIIGDVHGQFYDLLKILSYTELMRGQEGQKANQKAVEGDSKVVFLGDYVDRGINSVEVSILLIALKIEFPNRLILLRGNHETRVMTQQYNFREECLEKYSQEVYELLMDFFDSLPLVCVVNNAYFCVHGGISDKMMQMSRINSIERRREVPLDNNAFCDLIWSDPVDEPKGSLKSKWMYNYSRDCSIVYGAALVNQFLRMNGLTTVIRAHEVFIEGYKMHMWNKSSDIPPVITVFSAPNYCGNCGNKGAILKIDKGEIRIKQIKEQEPEKHKFLYKFDVFSWTLPEIMRNVHSIMVELTKSYVDTRIPELKKQNLETKALFLIKYAYHAKIIENTKVVETNIVRVSMSQQEERNYLFNRSVDYFAGKEKAPKHK